MNSIDFLIEEDAMRKILSSMIGNTAFYEKPELAELFQVNHLWIKEESSNLTGTIKDRKTLEMMRYDGTNKGYICITNGNMGFSLGTIMGKERVISIVDENIDLRIVEGLEKISQVLKLPLRKKRLTREDLIGITMQYTSDKTIRWNWEMETSNINLYNTFMNELYGDMHTKKLLDKDVKLVVPFGGGELMASCLVHQIHFVTENHRFFNMIYGYNTVGVTERNNFSQKMSRRIDYDTINWPVEDKEYVADKLVTAYISARAKRTITYAQKRGRAEVVTVLGEDILRAYKILCDYNIKVEPSSAAAFAGLWNMKEKPEHVVVINTGRGVVGYKSDN